MKHTIQIRQYGPNQTCYGSAHIGPITGNYGFYSVLGTVRRTLQGQQIGNFNPLFCSYEGKLVLVHSDEGDLSDPFRRENKYATSLFIVV